MSYRQMQLSLTIEALERADKRIPILARSENPRLLGELMMYRDWLVEEVHKWNQSVQAERRRYEDSGGEHP